MYKCVYDWIVFDRKYTVVTASEKRELVKTHYELLHVVK